MSANLFNTVKVPRVKHSLMDLTHDVKLSCNMGQLVPTFFKPCLPSERVRISCDSLIRLAPMLAPMMHRCDVTMHYWFVPYRLLWQNWEKFITSGNATTPPAAPFVKIKADGSNYTKLLDYMDICNPNQVAGTSDENVLAFNFAAYQLIWHENYRDQNLQNLIWDPQTFILSDGDNSSVGDLLVLRNRCWEHDYFTSNLPFAQKGEPVTLPIAGFDDVPVKLRTGSADPGDDHYKITGGSLEPVSHFAQELDILLGTPHGTGMGDNHPYAETSSLEGQESTINDLRTAFRLQEFLEKNARGGTRYTEMIRAHFDKKSSDARLQRPEYITGTKSPIIISEVLNMTGTDDAPQGSMAGHGVSVNAGEYGHYDCEEHGVIIGIMSVMPKTAYQQGINRHYKKFDPLDYGWPEFDHLGEQATLNSEIFAFQDDGTEVFGYNPRFSEYKFMGNRVAGDFRTTLDFWHMGRIWDPMMGTPALNAGFVNSDPTTRVFAVTDPNVDHLWCQVLHKVKSVLPLSRYSTPTF